MSDRRDGDERAGARADEPSGAAARTAIAPIEDARKPYEAPRIVKRRSVIHATLFSPMGPTSSANTMTGN